MSKKVDPVVSDHSSNSSVSMLFQIEMDERLLDNNPKDEAIDYSALFDPEQAATLMIIDKGIRFRNAIESKIKAGGIKLKFAGKDKNGQDVYRLT